MNLVMIQIVLSFFIAGIWIATSTFLGERYGSRKAGLIASIPSPLIISLLFLAITKGVNYTIATTAGIPIGIMINIIFLAVFIFFVHIGLWVALAVSLVIWALVAAGIIVTIPPLGFGISVIVYLIVSSIIYIIVDMRLGSIKTVKKSVSFSWRDAFVRAFFAGSLVAGSVMIAQIAPPFMTGILATFPAIMISTMVIITKSQGPAFAQSTGKVLIFTSINIIAYIVSVRGLFPVMGPLLGTIAATIVNVFFLFLLSRLIMKLR